MIAAEEHDYARHDCNLVHNCFAIICALLQIRISIVAKFVDDGLTIIGDARLVIFERADQICNNTTKSEAECIARVVSLCETCYDRLGRGLLRI